MYIQCEILDMYIKHWKGRIEKRNTAYVSWQSFIFLTILLKGSSFNCESAFIILWFSYFAESDSSHRDGHDDIPTDTGQSESPAIVIYMINPFTYGNDSDHLSRQAMIGLLKCYQEIIPKLPESMQNSIYLEVGSCFCRKISI